MDSNVTIRGNLTRDPEVRYTQGGKALATFGVAVNKRVKVGNDWESEPMFFDVTAWGEKLVEGVAELEKGQRVIVSGRVEQRSWETKTGDKRSKVEIVADDVGLSLKWGPLAGRGGSGRPQQQRQNHAPPGSRYDSDEEPF